MIRIIDYGMGNSASVRNMIHKVGGRAEIISDPEAIASAEQLILPGVGHYKRAMENIHDRQLFEPIRHAALERKVPILGICLGMQLLTSHGEEGDADGLDLVKGQTVKFQLDTTQFKVPHMGWSFIQPKGKATLYTKEITDPKFYFAHSYYVKLDNPSEVVSTCNYGLEFCAGIEAGNVHGTQFHPEKSHKYGMALMKQFISLKP